MLLSIVGPNGVSSSVFSDMDWLSPMAAPKRRSVEAVIGATDSTQHARTRVHVGEVEAALGDNHVARLPVKNHASATRRRRRWKTVVPDAATVYEGFKWILFPRW